MNALYTSARAISDVVIDETQLSAYDNLLYNNIVLYKIYIHIFCLFFSLLNLNDFFFS